MIKKTYLEAPSAELIVVRFEENIMSYNNDNNEKPVDDGDVDF